MRYLLNTVGKVFFGRPRSCYHERFFNIGMAFYIWLPEFKDRIIRAWVELIDFDAVEMLGEIDSGGLSLSG